MDFNTILSLVGPSTLQTLAMVFVSTVFSVILGLPLGILLCVTDPASGIMPKPVLYQVLTRIVNALRSFPFMILMILLFPLSRFIVGSSIGTVKVLLPEALPSLVSGITLTIINLIGYSAMAGVIGGGGLGDLAIRYGYQRNQPLVMIPAVIIILILVEVIQLIGSKISNNLLARR